MKWIIYADALLPTLEYSHWINLKKWDSFILHFHSPLNFFFFWWICKDNTEEILKWRLLFYIIQFRSVQFSLSVMSDSLRPHELQHARPPCPSPIPRVHSNSCPSSPWCHPAISTSVIPFSSCPQSLPASVFSNESTLHMRWPKYWSFSFSIIPPIEIPGLISFRMDWRLATPVATRRKNWATGRKNCGKMKKLYHLQIPTSIK